MRTTGIRSVPVPAPRTQVAAGGPPQPLPRTKFYSSTAPTVSPPHQPASTTQHLAHSSNKDKNVTLRVIYEHGPPLKQNERDEVSQPNKSKVGDNESDLSLITSINTSAPRTPVRKAPPKPPRTFNHQVNSAQDTTHRNKMIFFSNRKVSELPKSTPIPSRPKLIDILYRPSPSQKAACDSKLTVRRIFNPDPSQTQTTGTSLSTERAAAQGTVNTTSALASLTSRDAQVSAATLRAAAGKTGASQSSVTDGGGERGAAQLNSSQSVDTRRSRHRVSNNRVVPFPPPAVPPPSVPSTAASGTIVQPEMSRPDVPARPTAEQVAAYQDRMKGGWQQRTMNDPLRMSSRARGTFQAPASTARSVDQDPVYTPADFEDNCKEVFKCIKAAKDHMTNGRHIQAASLYQAALTAIDRVLKAQVLSIVSDEHTRQRFFHQQQEVFIARKETLNGFSDAQAAVRPSRDLSSSVQPPGAPPSYDDVLREDLSLSRDESSEAPRQPCQPQSAGVGQGDRGRLRRGARPLTVDLTSRPRPPLLPQPLRYTRARSSSLRARQDGVEVLVDTSADPPRPPATPHTAPVNLTLQPLVPTIVSSSRPRPKSNHPKQQQDILVTLAKQPDDTTSCPVSSHTPFKTPVPKPRIFSKTNETSFVESGSPPPLDEAIFYQAQAMEKIVEQRKNEGLMADVVAATAEPTVQGALAENSLPSLEIPNKSYLTTGSNWSQLANIPKVNVKDYRVVKDDGDKTFPPGEAAVSAQKTPGSKTLQSYTSHSFNIIDPFKNKDPFPPIDTNTVKSNSVSPEGCQSSCMLVFSDTNNINSVSKTDTCKMPVATPVDTGFLRPSGEAGVEGHAAAAHDVKQGDRNYTDSPQYAVLAGGNSILEALDFAIYRTPSHRKASPQNSKGSIHSRSYSEDTLLDCSYGALNNYIESSKGLCASRASVIEEFDPLVSKSHDYQSPAVSADHKENKIDGVETHVEETKINVMVKQHRDYEDSDVFLPDGFSEEGAVAAAANLYSNSRVGGVPSYLDEKTGVGGLPADPPYNIGVGGLPADPPYNNIGVGGLPADPPYNSIGVGGLPADPPYNSIGVGGLPADPPYNNIGVGGLPVDPPYNNTRVGVLPANPPYNSTGVEGVPANLYGSKGPSPDYPNVIGTRSSVSSTGSCVSWPPDRVKNTSGSPQPISPPLADASGDDSTRLPWSSETEPEETSESGVGRSAFYCSLVTQKGVSGRTESGDGTGSVAGFRDLLKINEGVKIFFIYTDGVVTSPWNKPFLAASKDTSMTWYVGEGVVLRVGRKLWSCQLHSKSTLVLRMSSGIYIFKDVAGKPNCQAVGIRVPGRARKSQHELLSHILRENTLLEDERPTGLTKAISKGASSAASRVKQFVDDKSRTTNTAFIRQNSIRALRGMSKHLDTLAERTGSTMTELPPEYQELQEAANILRFSRTAKTIQYI